MIGKRAIYIKAGTAPFWNTEWPCKVIGRSDLTGRYAILCDGQRRVKFVKPLSLIPAVQPTGDHHE